MIKNLLLTSVALLTTTGAWANSFTRDGITYEIVDSNTIEGTETQSTSNPLSWTGTNKDGVLNITVTCTYLRTDVTTQTVKAINVDPSVTAPSINLTNGYKGENNTVAGSGSSTGIITESVRNYSAAINAAKNYGVTNILSWDDLTQLTDEEKSNSKFTYFYYQDFPGYGRIWLPQTIIGLSNFNYDLKVNAFYQKTKKDGTDAYVAYYSAEVNDKTTTEVSNVYNYVITTIDKNLLSNNKNVTSISFSGSVTDIESGAFKTTSQEVTISSLATITPNSTTNFVVEDGILYKKENGNKVAIVATTNNPAAEVKLAATVTSIYNNAFDNSNKQVNLITSNETLGNGYNGTSGKFAKTILPASLSLGSQDANGGYTVTGAVNKANLATIAFQGTYIKFTGLVTEDLGTITNNSSENTLLIFTNPNGKTISGTNVVNGSTCSNLVVKDGCPFYTPVEFTATEATYNRSISTNWGTLCIPFKAEGTYNNGNVVYGKLEEYINGTLTFRYGTDLINANTPYLVKAKSSASTVIGKNALVPSSGTSSSTTVTNATFYGVQKAVTVAAVKESNYTTFGFSNGKLAKLGDAVNIPAYRCYINILSSSIASAAGIRAVLLDAMDTEMETIEEETTSINGIENVNEVEAMYNINGQRVNNVQSNGLYIINGKKVIVK